MVKVWYLIITTSMTPNVAVMTQHVPIMLGEEKCRTMEKDPGIYEGIYISARCEARLRKKSVKEEA